MTTLQRLTTELLAAKRRRMGLIEAGGNRLIPGVCSAIAEVYRIEDEIAIEKARLAGKPLPERGTYIITAKEA